MEFAAFFFALERRITLPYKRWCTAITIIYSSRAIQSLAKKKLNAVLRSPSYVALDIHATGRSLVFDVDAEVLSTVIKEKSLDDLHWLGGVEGLVDKLPSDREAGSVGSIDDLRQREEVLGSNTYPKLKPKGFFWFVYEALNDLFLLILIICAVVSFEFGIKENGI